LTRIAWFTPLPHAASGVAQYSMELLSGLSATSAIDVFVAATPGLGASAGDGVAAQVAVHNAHDFVWKHVRQPYDVIVYQLGNAPCHDYMWAYFVRYPGIIVLHDGQVHHARARALMAEQREEDYRREFLFNHPEADGEIAELGIAGLLGALTYLWPMRRVVVEAARLVVVHNRWLADEIRADHPAAHVHVIDMGVPAPVVSADARSTVRRRHGLPDTAVVFVAFGEVTPEKRISQAIHALASLASAVPDARLLLAGRPAGHYDAAAEARRLGVGDRVVLAGFVAQDEVDAYIAAADVCLCLRWPSSRETSAAWLRCLAAGKPTVTTDLAHTVDIPALDPRSWNVQYAPVAGSQHDPDVNAPEPVSVGIDILDEDHSLRLAMRRLATDARLRAALGQSAHRLWQDRFTLGAMVARYRAVLDAARGIAPPDADGQQHLPAHFPGHFTTDGTEFATEQLVRLGVPASVIDEIWQRPGGPPDVERP
jgi:glycosyltransferase involved in cell wall biosynthesis